MKVTYKKVITNCLDCPHHSVQPDPDPHDSFCSDDVKVICLATGRKENKVAVACRPYRMRKEAQIPIWCPLAKAAKAR